MKLIDIWRKFTNREPEKQSPVIVLSLEDEAQDVFLELETHVISGTDGVDKITVGLCRLNKKDATLVHRFAIFLLNSKNATIKQKAMVKYCPTTISHDTR